MNCPACHKQCSQLEIAAARYSCNAENHSFYYVEEDIFELSLHVNDFLIVSIKRCREICYIYQSRTATGFYILNIEKLKLFKLPPHIDIDPQTPQQAAKLLTSYVKLLAFL